MFSDVQFTISSLEFSIFFKQNTLCCPSCGTLLENEDLNQMRLSSLLLLIGFGSYFYYKHIIKKKKKLNNISDKNHLIFENSRNNRFFDRILRARSNWFNDYEYSYADKSYLYDNYDFLQSINSSNCEKNRNITEVSETCVSSLFMAESRSACEDTTVAKLDQLILQIQNIKESVEEIDTDFNDIKKSNLQYKLSSNNTSFSAENDINDSITEPQTPSLEWDLTDLIDLNTQFDIKSLDLPLPVLEHNLFNSFNINQSNNIETIDSLSPFDSNSLLSSNEFCFSDKKLTIKRIIEEVSKLGLLNDLKEVLENDYSKRDSAYFED